MVWQAPTLEAGNTPGARFLGCSVMGSVGFLPFCLLCFSVFSSTCSVQLLGYAMRLAMLLVQYGLGCASGSPPATPPKDP